MNIYSTWVIYNACLLSFFIPVDACQFIPMDECQVPFQNDQVERKKQYLTVDEDFINGLKDTRALLIDEQWSENFNYVCSLVEAGEEFIEASYAISAAHEGLMALRKNFPLRVVQPLEHKLLQTRACSRAVKEGRDWPINLTDQEFQDLQIKRKIKQGSTNKKCKATSNLVSTEAVTAQEISSDDTDIFTDQAVRCFKAIETSKAGDVKVVPLHDGPV